MQVARVRPAAIEIARILDGGDGSAVIGAALGGTRRRRGESVADDLLASALLLEGLCGDATSQLVVDHMRKQRKLSPLPWSALRGAEEQASSAPCHGSPPEETVTPFLRAPGLKT
jgi:hypothetical protein